MSEPTIEEVVEVGYWAEAMQERYAEACAFGAYSALRAVLREMDAIESEEAETCEKILANLLSKWSELRERIRKAVGS